MYVHTYHSLGALSTPNFSPAPGRGGRADSPNNGLLYNWKYHQFVAIDPFLARVQFSVTLDPIDICYGFYSYQEPDIVFTGLDINPFTNQTVRNRIVQFYYKNDGVDHYHVIFWQILNTDGSVFSTNDPDQTLGTPHIFGSMVIGTSRGVQSFQTADIRNRGGGLAPNGRPSPRPSTSGTWDPWTGSPIPWAAGWPSICRSPSSSATHQASPEPGLSLHCAPCPARKPLPRRARRLGPKALQMGLG